MDFFVKSKIPAPNTEHPAPNTEANLIQFKLPIISAPVKSDSNVEDAKVPFNLHLSPPVKSDSDVKDDDDDEFRDCI